jgi:hypothetical protein
MEIAAAVEDEFHDVCETHVYIFGNTARLMSLCAALLQRELSLLTSSRGVERVAADQNGPTATSTRAVIIDPAAANDPAITLVAATPCATAVHLSRSGGEPRRTPTKVLRKNPIFVD